MMSSSFQEQEAHFKL